MIGLRSRGKKDKNMKA